MSDNIIKKALNIVGRKDLVSTFGLVDEAGFPFVSAVVVIKNEGLSEFWISTSPSSRKAQIIKQNNKAGLCYHDGDNNITLAGRAELVADPAMKEALWLEWMENFFPDGASDSGYILIKFTTQKLRLCIDGATRTRDFTMDEIAKVLK
jgi:general stress protein 26